jgi:hypothetical protein
MNKNETTCIILMIMDLSFSSPAQSQHTSIAVLPF